MISAPLTADLLNPKSWQLSERLPYPTDAAPGNTGWRGMPSLRRMAARHPASGQCEKAALVRVRGSKLKFIGLIDFPGGAKKFTIRYDRQTRRYWTLANPAPVDAEKPAAIRNTLSLISSSDLRDWRVERVIVSHPDALNLASSTWTGSSMGRIWPRWSGWRSMTRAAEPTIFMTPTT